MPKKINYFHLTEEKIAHIKLLPEVSNFMSISSKGKPVPFCIKFKKIKSSYVFLYASNISKRPDKQNAKEHIENLKNDKRYRLYFNEGRNKLFKSETIYVNIVSSSSFEIEIKCYFKEALSKEKGNDEYRKNSNLKSMPNLDSNQTKKGFDFQDMEESLISYAKRAENLTKLIRLEKEIKKRQKLKQKKYQQTNQLKNNLSPLNALKKLMKDRIDNFIKDKARIENTINKKRSKDINHIISNIIQSQKNELLSLKVCLIRRKKF